MASIQRLVSGFGVAFVLVSLHVAPACAALGEDASTIDADRARLRGSLTRIVTREGYALHEIRSEGGTNIREYVSSKGKVFAVAWDGPWRPDLEQVLGAHFGRYRQAADRVVRQRRTRGVLRIRDGDLVVEMSGHPRAFAGRAYLAGDVPSGVSADALR